MTTTVPATPASIGGASVLRIDESGAEALFQSFRDGSIFDRATDEVQPSDVRVQVLNGAGVGGLAGATRDALSALGYQVTGIGDAEPVQATVIRVPDGQQEQASRLASDLPVDPAIEVSGDVSVVTLVLGPDLAEGL